MDSFNADQLEGPVMSVSYLGDNVVSMFNFVKLLQSVHDIKIGRRVSYFAMNSHIV